MPVDNRGTDLSKELMVDDPTPDDATDHQSASTEAVLSDATYFPTGKYILEQEPDGRYRIIGTSPERKVTSTEPEKQYVPDKYFRVTDTRAQPYSCVGHTISTFENGERYIGSGFMIGKHHCLTAGHVIYSHKDGGYATSVQFNAGQVDEHTKPYGIAMSRRKYTLALYRDSDNRGQPDRDWDMGILLLDRELGDRTKWLEVDTANDAAFAQPMSVAGYPGKKGGHQLWISAGPVLSISKETIVYDNYVFGGTSGGPVYGSNNKVYGINVAVGQSGGIGCRITQGKLNRIAIWKTL